MEVRQQEQLNPALGVAEDNADEAERETKSCGLKKTEPLVYAMCV